MGISKKQLSILFFCNLSISILGSGEITLLPIYAVRLGADPAGTGVYIAIAFFTLTLGTLSAGWISGRFHRHKLPIFIVALINIPATWLMGQAASVGELTPITAFHWFNVGLELSLVGILAGLSAGEKERGKVFGTLGLTVGLGGLIGNLGVGGLVDQLGFPIMFSVMAIFMALNPLAALLLTDQEIKPSASQAASVQRLPGLGRSFYMLFTASVLIAVTTAFIGLFRSIEMDQLQFSSFEISSTGAIGGLVSIPFPFVMGWLSDRLGRKVFLSLGYSSAFFSILMIVFSSVLWNFWVAVALMKIAGGSNSIGNALVTDLVPRESVGKGLSVFGSATWIGNVIGYSIAGSTLQVIGLTPGVVLGACLSLAAVGILLSIRIQPAKSESLTIVLPKEG